MVGTDIETAARNRLGTLTIVFNNGALAIEVTVTRQPVLIECIVKEGFDFSKF